MPRQPSRLDKAECNLNSTINIVLAVHALGIAKGLWTHEDVSKMTDIVAKVRPKMSEVFTVEQAIRRDLPVVVFPIDGPGCLHHFVAGSWVPSRSLAGAFVFNYFNND